MKIAEVRGRVCRAWTPWLEIEVGTISMCLGGVIAHWPLATDLYEAKRVLFVFHDRAHVDRVRLDLGGRDPDYVSTDRGTTVYLADLPRPVRERLQRRRPVWVELFYWV